MRQLIITEERKVEWQETAAPRLESSKAALVRPIAVAVCDFDRAILAGRFSALVFPVPIGHEAVAQVIEVGEQVSTIQVGMQVIVPLQISCGTCLPCQAGRTKTCNSVPSLSNYGLGALGGPWGGAMSDLLVVPYADAMAVPVPPGMSPAACAAVGCNLPDVYRAVAPHLLSRPGASLLIVAGFGVSVALYACVMAKALGAATVDFVGSEQRHADAASALGVRAHALANGYQPDRLYDVVLVASDDPKDLMLGLACVAPEGVCTAIAPASGSVEIPLVSMFLNNVTLTTGQPHTRTNMDHVLRIMRERDFDSLSVPHEISTWESAPELYGRGELKRIFIRD